MNHKRKITTMEIIMRRINTINVNGICINIIFITRNKRYIPYIQQILDIFIHIEIEIGSSSKV